MCLLTPKNYAVCSGFRGNVLRISMCIMMSLFMTGCVDNLSLPNFPDVKKSPPQEQNTPIGQEYYAREPVKRIPSEKLLAEQGNWNLVEKSDVIDPMQAHLAARQEVDVKRRQNKKELSAHFQPNAKSGQDGKMRVLRLETDDMQDDDFEIAESSISKPTHAVAESELLNKIKNIFGENDESSQALVVPKRKPSRGATEAKGAVVVASAPAPKQISNAGSRASFLSKKPTSSEERMIGGVIVPPVVPPQKYTRVQKAEPVKVASSVVPQETGIVVPEQKPTVKTSKAPVAVAAPSKKKVEQAAQATYSAEAIRLRSGKHPGRTRLVLEVTQTTRYKVAIDHVRNVLRIKLEDTHWRLSPQETFTKSNLLGTYVARQQRDGSVLFEVRLKKKTKILDTMILRPNLSSNHRVVIDLKD